MTTSGVHPDLEESLARLGESGRVELGSFPLAALACLQLPSRSGLWRMPIALPPADQVDQLLAELVDAGLVEFGTAADGPRHVSAALRRPGDGDSPLPPADAPRVAVFGGLALVLALQASPTWVAEVHDPAGDMPDVVLHGGAAPPAVLEQRSTPAGDPALTLLRPEVAAVDLTIRCWAAEETHLRVVRPTGTQVRVNAVVVRRQGTSVKWAKGDREPVDVPSPAHLEDAIRRLLTLAPEIP